MIYMEHFNHCIMYHIIWNTSFKSDSLEILTYGKKEAWGKKGWEPLL